MTRQTVEYDHALTRGVAAGEKRSQQPLGDRKIALFQQCPRFQHAAEEIDVRTTDDGIGRIALDDLAQRGAEVEVQATPARQPAQFEQFSQRRLARSGRAQEEDGRGA